LALGNPTTEAEAEREVRNHIASVFGADPNKRRKLWRCRATVLKTPIRNFVFRVCVACDL
jgi:hypothetical protein